MFKRNFILLLLTLTIVIVLFNSTYNEEIEIINYSNVNDGVVLKDLTKISTINLNDQFVILNLWASWCIPCENEVSELKIISETKGYSVIGILVEDSAENGMEFIKKNKITYQNVLDNAIAESILIQFIWSGIPTTLVLDNNLNIISTISGEITANQLTFTGATMKGHIIPDADVSYDIGTPERKIRDIYISTGSMWVGDGHKMGVANGAMTVRKRKTDIIPQPIIDAIKGMVGE